MLLLYFIHDLVRFKRKPTKKSKKINQFISKDLNKTLMPTIISNDSRNAIIVKPHIALHSRVLVRHSSCFGLFEIRIQQAKDIFRIFCFFDQGQLVVLANGFQKKTQKTPKNEIDKAIKIKQVYENEKK